VPVGESLGAAVKLHEQGKIKDIGLCRVTLPEIKQARKVAKIVSIQNIYSVCDAVTGEDEGRAHGFSVFMLVWRRPIHTMNSVPRIGFLPPASGAASNPRSLP
jgi:aryl-alcohol dehydrogenase-like predicted oxidoreductase